MATDFDKLWESLMEYSNFEDAISDTDNFPELKDKLRKLKKSDISGSNTKTLLGDKGLDIVGSRGAKDFVDANIESAGVIERARVIKRVETRRTIEDIKRMTLPQLKRVRIRDLIDTAEERDALQQRRQQLIKAMKTGREREVASQREFWRRDPFTMDTSAFLEKYQWVEGLRSTRKLENFFFLNREEAGRLLENIKEEKRGRRR